MQWSAYGVALRAANARPLPSAQTSARTFCYPTTAGSCCRFWLTIRLLPRCDLPPFADQYVRGSNFYTRRVTERFAHQRPPRDLTIVATDGLTVCAESHVQPPRARAGVADPDGSGHNFILHSGPEHLAAYHRRGACAHTARRIWTGAHAQTLNTPSLRTDSTLVHSDVTTW